MKSAYFLLTASGFYRKALVSIPNVQYFSSGEKDGKNYDWIKWNNDYSFMIRVIARQLTWEKESISPLWDLILLVPEFNDTDKSLELFRKYNVQRRSLSNTISIKREDNQIDKEGLLLEGPFDLEQIEKELGLELNREEIDPDTGETIVHNPLRNQKGELIIPHVFAGDSAPETLAKMRYNPTTEECDRNIKALDSDVWIQLEKIDEHIIPGDLSGSGRER